jgi:aminoglycoside phosphotransferase (APT) family kinase protein
MKLILLPDDGPTPEMVGNAEAELRRWLDSHLPWMNTACAVALAALAAAPVVDRERLARALYYAERDRHGWISEWDEIASARDQYVAYADAVLAALEMVPF